MATCDACGVTVELPFKCSYCGGLYCATHRLPEAHSCPNAWMARAPEIAAIPERKIRPPSIRITSPLVREIQQILIAWFVLSFCFSLGGVLTPRSFPMVFFLSLITLGLGFICHELAHRFVARRLGCLAEFRLWAYGLLLALLMSFITLGRVIFAAPGAVYIAPDPRRWWRLPSRRDYGLIAISGALANIAIGLFFYALIPFGGIIRLVGMRGFSLNLWLAAFNLLPFGPMDGAKVFKWNPLVWGIITVPAWIASLFLI